jgi:hypothetical protein
MNVVQQFESKEFMLAYKFELMPDASTEGDISALRGLPQIRLQQGLGFEA